MNATSFFFERILFRRLNDHVNETTQKFVPVYGRFIVVITSFYYQRMGGDSFENELKLHT